MDPPLSRKNKKDTTAIPVNHCFVICDSAPLSAALYLLLRHGVDWQDGDLAMPEFVSGFFHCPQQGRPVVDIAGEDVGYHMAGQGGNEDVEHDRGIAHFVGEAGPV